MTEPANGNYCLECDANNGDCNDAYKYAKDANQLRDSMIGYGKRTIHYKNDIDFLVLCEMCKVYGSLVQFPCDGKLSFT